MFEVSKGIWIERLLMVIKERTLNREVQVDIGS